MNEKITYLQLLILIDYDDMPERIKYDSKVYFWNPHSCTYDDFENWSCRLIDALKYLDDKYLASEPCIEVIEE